MSMEWKVAPSYQTWNIDVIDEDSHKARVSTKCSRCGGSGMYIIPPHFSGTCFKCDGTGVEIKWVKAYSPEEYDKYITNRERAKARKADKEYARQQELKNNSEENKKALLEKFGYNSENPTVYLVVGKDTYVIKDEIKERGGRFDADLGWFYTANNEVPAGYSLAEVPFDNLYDWFPMVKRFQLKENAREIADAAKAQLMAPSESEYVGDIKDRLRDLMVTCTGRRTFDSEYGSGYIYTFSFEKNILVWMTTANKPIEPNNTYLLTGTVKDHKTYNGEKQTYLSRCIIKAA